MSQVFKRQRLAPTLAGLSDDVVAFFDTHARVASFEKGTRIFAPGQAAKSFVMPVSGTLRVQQRSDGCQPTILYRARADEGCMLEMAFRLTFETRTAEVIAETDVSAIVLPRTAFDDLMSVSNAFRAFVFDACKNRILALFTVIEETMARSVEARLAAKLVELRQPARFNQTRQKLSIELGTSHETISEHLYLFERRGWLEVEHDVITLKDALALKDLAQGQATFQRFGLVAASSNSDLAHRALQ